MEKFVTALYSAGERHFIGVYESEGGQFVLLKLRADVDHGSWRGQLPHPLQKSDVVVLTELILKQLLNVDEATLNDEAKINTDTMPLRP